MPRLGRVFAALLAGFNATAFGWDQPPSWVARGSQPVPDGVELRLSTDREEYFFGENILIHVTVANTTETPFSVNVGHDYRGAVRPLRYQAIGADAEGRPLADPYPSKRSMGGMGGPFEVTANQPFHSALAITRYLRFERPGVYTIRVRHDFGWKDTPERPLPVGEITLTLKQPTADEAHDLIWEWFDKKRRYGLWGEKQTPYPDFSQIRNPVFLPALVEAAHVGKRQAVVGVGSIVTPEATTALIDFASGVGLEDLERENRRELQMAAIGELKRRMPNPRFATGFHQGEEVAEAHQWLIEKSWDARFNERARTLAASLLSQADENSVEAGAYLLEGIGEPKDLGPLMEAIDREIARRGREAVSTPWEPGACHLLRLAVEQVLERGADPPTDPSTHGEALAFLVTLGRDESFRPDGWVGTCDRLLASDAAYLRRLTLENLPEPMPQTLQRHLRPILAAPAISPALKVCHIAERDGLTELRDPLLAKLRVAKNSWMFNSVDQASNSLGGGYKRLEILVDRLDERGMLFLSLDALKSIFSNAGGGGHSKNIDVAAEARRVKPLWEDFLRRHEDDLRAGKQFRLPAPEVSPDMFPEQYTITLQDVGGSWPPRP